MKNCNRCNVEKSLNDFGKHKNYKDGHRCICNECKNKISAEYRKNNKEKIKKYSKQYCIDNKIKILTKEKEKRNSNPLVKLTGNIRTAIGTALRENGYTKTNKTAIILGCSFIEFKSHLESQFLPWMNWENYGKYNGELNYGWDMDHIIPLSIGKTEEDIIKLNHYSNLQPLCSYVNRVIKKDNLTIRG